MAYIYRHIRFDKNEPFYIGIGSDFKYKRAYDKKSRNRHWNNIVSNTDYKIDILIDNISWEEACEKEKEFIALYGRRDLGLGTLVNLTDGGEGSIGRVYSNSDRLRMRINNSGERNPFYGKRHTDEFRLNLSKRNTGKKWTDLQREKYRVSRLGSKHTIESRLKMSKSQTGRKHPDCVKSKIGSSNSRLVFHTGCFVFYDNVTEAAHSVGIKYGTLTSMLRGKNRNKTKLIYI